MVVFPVMKRGPRLLMRELTQEDAGRLWEIYGDPVATKNLSFEPRTRDAVDQFVAKNIESARAADREEYVLAFDLIEGDKLVGMGRLALDSPENTELGINDILRPVSGQLGGALRSDSWRQGLGTEGIRLLLELAFVDLELHRVWGAAGPANSASLRLMAAAGMSREGTIRHHIEKSGQYRDSIVYSILAVEWNRLPVEDPEEPLDIP